MGRRLAEATKACRTRRTRGDTGLALLLGGSGRGSLLWQSFALPESAWRTWSASCGAVCRRSVETGRCGLAKSRARAERKFQREPQPQNGALNPYLLPKVGTHDGKIVFCETSYYFMLKVIGGSCNRVPVTFLVRRPAFFDRFFQTVVEVLVFSALRDLGLIVEFDLIDQQAGKTLGLAVDFLILGRNRRLPAASRRGLMNERPASTIGSGSANSGSISATADWTSAPSCGLRPSSLEHQTRRWQLVSMRRPPKPLPLPP